MTTPIPSLDMLERCANPYILSYRTAKQRIEEDNSCVFGFRILDPSLHDPRWSVMSTLSERESGEITQGDQLLYL